MTLHRVEILIRPRPGLLDPEGKAIQHALSSLGFEGVPEVRVGKAITLDLEAPDGDEARARARRMCEKLLANPVTEDFEVHLADEQPDPVPMEGGGE